MMTATAAAIATIKRLGYTSHIRYHTTGMMIRPACSAFMDRASYYCVCQGPCSGS